MLPSNREDMRKKLNGMTIDEILDYVEREFDVNMRDMSMDEAVAQHAEEMQVAYAGPALKQMETPEPQDSVLEGKESDTPNTDEALRNLKTGALDIPGLSKDAIIEMLMEKLDSLLQPIKPYIEAIKQLEEEYNAAEGDNAKENIKNKIDKEKERLQKQIDSLKESITKKVEDAIDTIKNAYTQLKNTLERIKDMCISCINIMAQSGALGMPPNPMKNAADAKVIAVQMYVMLDNAVTPCIAMCQASQEIHFDLPEPVTSVMNMIATIKQTIQGVIVAASALGG